MTFKIKLTLPTAPSIEIFKWSLVIKLVFMKWFALLFFLFQRFIFSCLKEKMEAEAEGG